MRRFENQVAFITGAAAGIGRATARRIANEGGRIFGIDVDADGVAETAKLVIEGGGEAEGRVCDVTDRARIDACVAECVERFGRIDVLCNVAGILRFDHFGEMDTETWNRLLAVNLSSVFHVTQAALPHLIESKGNVVNASSSSALKGLPYGVAYSATKGGISAFTRSLAVELSGTGVRVNAVCPASIETAMTSGDLTPKDADLRLLLRQAAIGGPRPPEVVAGVIAMLASGDGVHVNGEEIRVDGAALA